MPVTAENARLRLVQALYQMDMTAIPVEQLIIESSEHALDENAPPEEQEQAHFELLLRGVVQHLDVIDEKLQASLAEGWRAERMDRTLRAILRAGLHEILFSPLLPAQGVIADYGRLAESFFSASQASVVRGVLQRVSRESRTRP